MTVAVIVPWRPGCPYRLAAWERVRAEWDGAWPVHTVDDGGEPFSRAASINLAIADHPADVYVIADADTLIDLAQAVAAIELAAWSPGLVVAFDRFAYLTWEGTQQVLDGYDGSWEPLAAWTMPDTVSSCVALSHDTWTAVGGFDPRFRSWGYEDVQLEVAAATLVAPTRRLPGTCWHLWHPPARQRPTVNLDMLNEYLALRADPAGMRDHLEHVRSVAA